LRVGVKDEVASLVLVLACEELVEFSEDSTIEVFVFDAEELIDSEEDEAEETPPAEQAVRSKIKNVGWVNFINLSTFLS
jgi:hypothetical protein